MSESKTQRQRPMSPFMIGPYYRPQLTSMLSILHRIMGMALVFGALLFVWWLFALGAGPQPYSQFMAVASSAIGQVSLAAAVFGLIYHTLNGVRHMLWDLGWGLDLEHTYATGYIVVALSVIATLACWYVAFMRGGA